MSGISELTIGLDVSTSTTGIAVLSDDFRLVELSYVNTQKCETLWEAADAVRHVISRLNLNRQYVRLCIEESLQSFRSGFSSASTLSTLSKFNGIVSYMARVAFGIDPTYIQASTARKLCNVKLVKATTQAERRDPLWTKRQVFAQMTAQHPELATFQFPMTRGTRRHSSRIANQAYDMIDAYVIARAGLIQS
jgi:hypothetical protein